MHSCIVLVAQIQQQHVKDCITDCGSATMPGISWRKTQGEE
jgi:hypothetical protein